MLGIRHNIFISILLHSFMLAAAFFAGSSSELKVKRLIDVSLIEELKTGIERSRSEAPSHQRQPKINSVNVAVLKPRAELFTPPDISGRKETVISTSESEVKPSPAIINIAVTSVNGSAALSGVQGAGPNTSPAGDGTVFATQGKTTGNASAMSNTAGSRQQQGPQGDASLSQKIRGAIQANLVYPYIARKKRIEGTVLVAFKINQTGKPEEFRIVRSSGYAILDTAAKETVFRASPFPVADKVIEIPVTFLLKNN
jgi:protein TonB